MGPSAPGDRADVQRSGCRYDTVDYFNIDRRVGDNESFKKMLNELHKRGIKVPPHPPTARRRMRAGMAASAARGCARQPLPRAVWGAGRRGAR